MVIIYTIVGGGGGGGGGGGRGSFYTLDTDKVTVTRTFTF